MRVGRIAGLNCAFVFALGWCGVALGQGAPRIVTGDGAGSPVVKRFTYFGGPDGSFLPYTPSFAGGVRVAAGDVNGDGWVDIVTGPGPSALPGHVKVFSGQDFS